MMAATNQLTYNKLAKSGLRLCVVDDEYGWFHLWENYAEVIEPAQQNGVVYDLSGRRVAKAQNGLYIVNGKKVIVK